MEIVVGTRNAHKIQELTRILEPLVPQLTLVPAPGPSPVEDGETFSENALIKARAAFADSGLPSIADDSGLVVDALGGAPGIHSARYSGTGIDEDNTALVLSQMVGVVDRRARFVCAAALVHSGGELVLERSWEGSLAEEPSGLGGFGYDPIFVPEGHSRTAGELRDQDKDALSHRGQAFRALAEHLLALR
ncbi:MAG: RdgB/HAM1 family non-canonical purine NTP pyrophosphatase [Actinobacteria bacterium]|uniref:dITP/XTP pyrophosphatase n=1 Tax=freshwater metagenome TaxID=449393 RepID=A0A6J6KEC6_9ZZZZ|nr:RdgB/HAM1 family non-canonical purine NTP pyrophosphatase [Actinomycetota bacterium]